MRSYQQFCALARALDVIGDRWTLLLVRELAISPARYVDLRDGLPGIATNLLADRLRQLEADGVIRKTELPPPASATVYELTDWGRGLVPVLHALMNWGGPLMANGPDPDDHYRVRWMGFGIPALLQGAPADPGLHVTVRIDGEVLTCSFTDDGPTVSPGEPDLPHVVLTGSGPHILGILAGELPLRSSDDVDVQAPAGLRRRLGAVIDQCAQRRARLGATAAAGR